MRIKKRARNNPGTATQQTQTESAERKLAKTIHELSVESSEASFDIICGYKINHSQSRYLESVQRPSTNLKQKVIIFSFEKFIINLSLPLSDHQLNIITLANNSRRSSLRHTASYEHFMLHISKLNLQENLIENCKKQMCSPSSHPKSR